MMEVSLEIEKAGVVAGCDSTIAGVVKGDSLFVLSGLLKIKDKYISKPCDARSEASDREMVGVENALPTPLSSGRLGVMQPGGLRLIRGLAGDPEKRETGSCLISFNIG
ncbi:hypothetical protein [Paludibaculum fermentans]|uniref:hypothetical protein n=1 Tax=Paludibaculum fermentans TaxID=1473598 RepID=UPI003EB8CDD6